MNSGIHQRDARSSKETFMQKQTHGQQSIQSPNRKKPLDPREFPKARDERGSAGREEIRTKTPMVSAPRQSDRPVERTGQKRALPR